jgi:tryptophan synthase alpha chain
MNMNRFQNLFAKNKNHFAPYITAGDPDLKTTLKLMQNFSKQGVSFIELGIPFTDPMADGPVIQRAHERALKNKVQIKDVLELVKTFRKDDAHTPVILMGYYNPLYQFGLEKFAKSAREAGIDGVLIVDLPVEEATHETLPLFKKYHLNQIFLTTPTTTPGRLKEINKHGSGFVYYVSLKGITGADLNVNELKKDIKSVKTHIKNIPLMIGFGIKTPQLAKQAAPLAKGVIVGSALIEAMEKEKSQNAKVMAVQKLTQSFLTALTS